MVLTRKEIKFSPSMMLFRPTIIKTESGESKKLPTKIFQPVFSVVIVNTHYTKIDTRCKEKTTKLALYGWV